MAFEGINMTVQPNILFVNLISIVKNYLSSMTNIIPSDNRFTRCYDMIWKHKDWKLIFPVFHFDKEFHCVAFMYIIVSVSCLGSFLEN